MAKHRWVLLVQMGFIRHLPGPSIFGPKATYGQSRHDKPQEVREMRLQTVREALDGTKARWKFLGRNGQVKRHLPKKPRWNQWATTAGSAWMEPAEAPFLFASRHFWDIYSSDL